MAFHLSKAIVRSIEKQISEKYGLQFINNIENSNTPLKKPAEELNNGFFFPLRLMLLGFHLWAKDYKKFAIILLIFLLVISIFETTIQQSFGKNVMEYILYIIIGISAFVSIFSTPSSFTTYKINNGYIENVHELIAQHKIDNKEKIDLIQSNLDIFENRAKIRIKSIKVIIAFISATLIFIYKKHFDDIMSMNNKELLEVLKYSGFALVPYWLTDIYSKTILFIFNTAQVSLNEYKFEKL